MPTALTSDFRHGLDLRRGPLTAIGGSLQALTNAVITPGGEIAKRLAFVPLGALNPVTRGLIGQGGKLHTFSIASPQGAPISPPVPLVNHMLAAPPTTSQVLDYLQDMQPYKGKFWVSGHTTDGQLVNWYDGAVAQSTPGDFLRAYQSKLYRTAGNLLRFTAVDTPNSDANTPDTPGGGFIDLSANDPDGEILAGLEVYYNALAVFARHSCQILAVDPDPSLNVLKQVVRQGSLAPRSIRTFGTGDVLFLADSGIRSLRALNSTLAASVIDVGSPIDALVRAAVRDTPVQAIQSQAVVNPASGRFMLAIGQTIYVLSFYPSAKISAWSQFTVPFTVAFWAVVGDQLYARGTDNMLYLYGGADGRTYDSCEVRVRLPHNAIDKPNVMKKVQAVSAICTGSWSIGLGMVADNTDLFEPVANVVNSTVTQHRIPAVGHGTHIGMELVSAAPGPATLSAVAADYETSERL